MNFIDVIFLIIGGLLVLTGSVGIYDNSCIFFGIASAILFLGVKLIQNKKINIPSNFFLYFFFVLVLLAHTLVFDGKLVYFWLFLLGGLWWFLIYNIQGLASKYFSHFLIFLGGSMALLFLYSNLHGISYQIQESLYLPILSYTNHNHLGDLWAVILVSIIYQIAKKGRAWHYAVLFIGLSLIILSFSRSSLISLATGSVFIFYNLAGKTRLKKFVVPVLVGCILLFIYFGLFKTTIFARPYYLESLASVFHSPLGIGMGNFYQVSSGIALTHNFILEVVLGTGVFSIVFIVWLVKILHSLFKRNDNVQFRALFIAIGVNFLFDTTYVIPGMLLIWFSALAISQS